ncbi:hypothetical protein HMPREF9554_02089, partial [Treponema phagedenis F0421]
RCVGLFFIKLFTFSRALIVVVAKKTAVAKIFHYLEPKYYQFIKRYFKLTNLVLY